MSLCGDLRSEAVLLRQDDLTNCARAHRDALRALRAVHALVLHNLSPSLLENANFDTPPTLKSETEFLEEFDLSRGRTFDASKLNITNISTGPAIPPIPKSSTQRIDPAGTKAKSEQGSPSTSSGVSTKTDHNANSANASIKLETRVASTPTQVGSGGESVSVAATSKLSSVNPLISTHPSSGTSDAVPTSDSRTLDQAGSHAPAKTVHLPPQEVQEAKLRERQAAEARNQVVDAADAKLRRPTVPQIQAFGDVPSSPSSTVGPHSAATPRLPEESPDTSPESERLEIDETLVPEDLRPSPEERRAKEQHDRLHAAQVELARKQALGDVRTPDDQLRWEAQEAAVRDARNHAASTTSTVVDSASQTALVADALESDAKLEADPITSKASSEAKRPNKRDAAHVNSSGAQEDLDNITVTPRLRNSVSYDSTPATAPKVDVTPTDQRGIQLARMNNNDRDKKSGSDLLQTPTSRARLSEHSAPSSQLKQADGSTASPSLVFRSPKLATHPRIQSRVQTHDNISQTQVALDKLIALRGAASDPDRDYLEPLFRIQAHDSPGNTFSKSLPDLVRMAPKSVTTEDHFTQLHERIDFRMLRRIYQLQNANKWSLRQMEKAKEPEAPISHHDYMMAEMKSMRKDFRAERKTKKSVCAWLAQRCAQWVAASPHERKRLQVKIRQPETSRRQSHGSDSVPELDHAGDSAAEDEMVPSTPAEIASYTGTLIVAPELLPLVEEMNKGGKLDRALESLPKVGIIPTTISTTADAVAPVSKFVEGRLLPSANVPLRKRSRYVYEDEEELLASQPHFKRARIDAIESQDTPACALFDPENKSIRDRLHTNNTFRPPSEFLMPSTSFYENRNGSQWTWEDDQKLKRLAKDDSFNWSLIADELNISGTYKSSYDRRTPWECFERWVELESLPADMKRTVYFKTWFQRLEQSAQAAERRYQAQVALLQQQAQQNGTQPRELQRRKLTPSRVEKRRGSRYLWVIDGCRKIAKKREQQAWKFAEAARAAAQRKSQTDSNPQRQLLTPQEISKKRYQQDLQLAAQQREQAQKIREQQARMLQQARLQQQHQSQQGQHPHQAQIQQNVGAQNHQQQRQPGAVNMLAQQAQMQVSAQTPGVNGSNSQLPQHQQARAAMPMQAPNARMAVPQMNGQNISPAQMQQAHAAMTQQRTTLQQQMAHAQRSAQYGGQQFQMQSGNMASPGAQLTPQQLQQLYAQQQQQQQHAQAVSNGIQTHAATQNVNGQQASAASPSMPPPPNPQQHTPQQLSSGHVPQIIQIKNQLRQNNPNITDDQLTQLATQQMQIKNQSPANNHQNAARQNAMNAAAGIGSSPHANMQTYSHNQQNGYQNATSASSGQNGGYTNGDGNSGQQTHQAQQAQSHITSTTAASQAYAQKMWQRQMAQMAQQRQSPNTTHARLAGSSPSMAHASPNMAPASPVVQVQYPANMNNIGAGAQRPPSRSATPQMQRLGSSGSVPGVHPGMQSPGGGVMQQNSPRNMQASMAR